MGYWRVHSPAFRLTHPALKGPRCLRARKEGRNQSASWKPQYAVSRNVAFHVAAPTPRCVLRCLEVGWAV